MQGHRFDEEEVTFSVEMFSSVMLSTSSKDNLGAVFVFITSRPPTVYLVPEHRSTKPTLHRTPYGGLQVLAHYPLTPFKSQALKLNLPGETCRPQPASSAWTGRRFMSSCAF